MVTDPNTGQKSIKSVEVGLSPGQTAGMVGGSYVERPEGYSTSGVFVVDIKEQAAQKKKILESRTATHTSAAEYERQVRYMGSIAKPVTPLSEISIKPPGFTPAQLHSLENMPRASGAAAQRKSLFFKTNLPTRDLGADRRLQLRPYPSTPIEKETPEGYGYATYPLYKKARDVSEEAQAYAKRSIYKVPYAPKQVKEVATGFSSMVTGFPEFVASGAVGWEHAGKRVGEGKAKQLPGEFGTGLGLFAGSVAKSAKEQPYETAGMGLGIILTGRLGKRGGKTPVQTYKTPLRTKLFGSAERGRMKKAGIETWSPPELKPTVPKQPILTKMFGKTTLTSLEKANKLYKANKPQETFFVKAFGSAEKAANRKAGVYIEPGAYAPKVYKPQVPVPPKTSLYRKMFGGVSKALKPGIRTPFMASMFGRKYFKESTPITVPFKERMGFTKWDLPGKGYPKLPSSSFRDKAGFTQWDLPAGGIRHAIEYKNIERRLPISREWWSPEKQEITKHFTAERGRNILYTSEFGDFIPGSYLYGKKAPRNVPKKKPTFLKGTKTVNVLDMLLVQPQGQLYRFSPPKKARRTPSLNVGYKPTVIRKPRTAALIPTQEKRYTIQFVKPDTKHKTRLGIKSKHKYSSTFLLGFKSDLLTDSQQQQGQLQSTQQMLGLQQKQVTDLRQKTRTTSKTKQLFSFKTPAKQTEILKKRPETPRTPKKPVKPLIPKKPRMKLPLPPKIPKIKSSPIKFKLKFKKPKRGTYKFKERTGVMLPSQMLFGTRKKTKSSLKFRKWKK